MYFADLNIYETYKRRHSARGEANGQTNLTEKDVVDIRRIYSEENITQKELAEKYNIGKTTVGRILRKETWKHI